jgi:hypothetical protein
VPHPPACFAVCGHVNAHTWNPVRSLFYRIRNLSFISYLSSIPGLCLPSTGLLRKLPLPIDDSITHQASGLKDGSFNERKTDTGRNTTVHHLCTCLIFILMFVISPNVLTWDSWYGSSPGSLSAYFLSQERSWNLLDIEVGLGSSTDIARVMYFS